MDEMRKLLDALAEVRDDVDFEHEQALVDDGIIDSLDLTQIMLALDDAFGIHIPAGLGGSGHGFWLRHADSPGHALG